MLCESYKFNTVTIKLYRLNTYTNMNFLFARLFVWLLICSFIRLLNCLFVHLSFVSPFVWFVHLFAHWFVCLSICLLTCLFTWSFVYSACLFVHFLACSLVCLFGHLLVCSLFCPFAQLSLSLTLPITVVVSYSNGRASLPSPLPHTTI